MLQNNMVAIRYSFADGHEFCLCIADATFLQFASEARKILLLTTSLNGEPFQITMWGCISERKLLWTGMTSYKRKPTIHINLQALNF
jgi:hypothetical protein